MGGEASNKRLVSVIVISVFLCPQKNVEASLSCKTQMCFSRREIPPECLSEVYDTAPQALSNSSHDQHLKSFPENLASVSLNTILSALPMILYVKRSRKQEFPHC